MLLSISLPKSRSLPIWEAAGTKAVWVTKYCSETEVLTQGLGMVQGSSAGERVFPPIDAQVGRFDFDHIPENYKKTVVVANALADAGTRATIEMCAEMGNLGADAVLVHTPCFYKNAMTPPALIAHYQKMIGELEAAVSPTMRMGSLEVALESPVPVILYNVPPNTGIDMNAETIIELAQHPNIIGLKDSGGDVDKLGRVVTETKGGDFQVLAGSAGFLLRALQVGCVGGVCAAANVFGPQVMELMAAHQGGDGEKARELQELLVKPNLAITRELGVPGLKQAMDWLGYVGGPVRPPLLPLNDGQKAHLKRVLLEANLITDENGKANGK